MTTLSGSHQGTLESLLSRLETVTSRLENIQDLVQAQVLHQLHLPQWQITKASLAPAVAALLEAAQPLGAEILKASELVEKAFFKPTPNELPILVAPVAEHMQAATAMTEGRRSAVFNHQKVVAESLHALSWMVYTGPNCGLSLPPQHVEESWQSAEFFANKVMMEFRNADSRHVDWVKALKQLFQQLKAYVKQHHMAGPSWNPRGVPLTDFKADKNASAASSPGPAVVSASAPRPPPP
ncbi:MAG: Adenylyl cyclase-associated, partial [Trebouxia sp. A1-2]